MPFQPFQSFKTLRIGLTVLSRILNGLNSWNDLNLIFPAACCGHKINGVSKGGEHLLWSPAGFIPRRRKSRLILILLLLNRSENGRKCRTLKPFYMRSSAVAC